MALGTPQKANEQAVNVLDAPQKLSIFAA